MSGSESVTRLGQLISQRQAIAFELEAAEKQVARLRAEVDQIDQQARALAASMMGWSELTTQSTVMAPQHVELIGQEPVRCAPEPTEVVSPKAAPPEAAPACLPQSHSVPEGVHSLTNLSRKSFQVVQLLRQVLDDLGGGGTRAEIMAAMKQIDGTFTVHKLKYQLQKGNFQRRGGKWHYVSGPLETSKEQAKMMERVNVLRDIINDNGGEIRWSKLFDEVQRRVGDKINRNNFSYALRNGPFFKGDNGYRYVGGDDWVPDLERT